MWPTRRRRARRSRVEPSPSRPILAASLQRPAQSILPRRLIDSPSASRPTGGFVFPPPADYVPPPLPREEIRPIRPAERPPALSPPAEYVAPAPPGPVPAPALEVPPFLIPIEEPIAPPDDVEPPVDVAPATFDGEPARIETAPMLIGPEPPFEPEPERVEAVAHPVEPASPVGAVPPFVVEP